MPTYDAFLSYSHAEDRGVARRLHTGVEKFAKPWYRVRGLRLFLDENSLSANPGLWSSIESALADSSWFVLVTSPRAADSKWVDREIRWWLQNRSADRLLIVLADGKLSWDQEAGDFDAEASTALPPALLGVLAEEPLWVTVPEGASEELELREAIVDVATAIRGVSKEELVSTAAREHRRTMRWARGAIAGLLILLAAAVVAGRVAVGERGTAIDQARLAESRQIASASQSVAGTDLDAAMLLAVQAYREDANPQTRAALFSAATESPRLVRFLDAGAGVEKLAASGGGRQIAAGLVDGRVLLWSADERRPTPLFDLPRRISSLAISDDGSVVVAADKTRALLWQRGQPLLRLPVPVGQHADLVGLSPSGKTVAYHAEPMVEGARESITVASVADVGAHTVHPGIWLGLSDGALLLPSDRRLLIFGSRHWEWREIPSWSPLTGAEISLGARQGNLALSADGRFFTVENGVSRVPVWPVAGHTDTLEVERFVDVPLTGLRDLALSPDGGRIAVAGAGGIHVAPLPQGSEPEGAEVLAEPSDLSGRSFDLTGQEAELIAFAGDDSSLVSATGSEIGVWSLDQLDRLAEVSTVPLQAGCTACPGPQVAISPDGRRLAVVDGFGEGGFVQSLDDDGDRRLLPDPEYGYGTLMWEGDGEFAVILAQTDEGVGDVPPGEQVPPDVRILKTAAASLAYEAVIGADGDTVISIDWDGNVYWQDAETGELLETSEAPRPRSFAEEEEGLEGAAISGSPELLATAKGGVVTVQALPGREELARIDSGEYPALAFAGNHLLVLRRDGALQVWSARGTSLRRTLAGEEPPDDPQLVASPDGTIVAHRRRDSSIELDDLDTGAELATFSTLGQSIFYRTGVAFSPDGATLVTVSEAPGHLEKGELVRREISPESLISNACEAAGRDLTAAEWDALVGTDPPDDLGCR